MTDSEKTFPMDLSNSAVLGLLAMVNGQGWAKSPKLQRRAFRLRKAIPKVVRPATATEAWDSELVPTFDLPERERDTGKTCLTWYSEQGQLLNNEHVESLFDAFGVHE